MERLTKTYRDGSHGAADSLPCGENSYQYKGLLLETLGKYEDAEEQGFLVKMPCKPGDTIYYVADGKITEKHVIGFLYTNQLYIVTEEFNFSCPAALIGHALFITREEAEAKLKEMESKQWMK